MWEELTKIEKKGKVEGGCWEYLFLFFSLLAPATRALHSNKTSGAYFFSDVSFCQKRFLTSLGRRTRSNGNICQRCFTSSEIADKKIRFGTNWEKNFWKNAKRHFRVSKHGTFRDFFGSYMVDFRTNNPSRKKSKLPSPNPIPGDAKSGGHNKVTTTAQPTVPSGVLAPGMLEGRGR